MNVLTTYEIATLCNVDITTVINWIESGKLVAYKTPGGHRRIKKEDFLRFLKTYQLPMPRGLSSVGKKVLIVDDDDQARDLFHETISAKWPGAEIFEASDAFTGGKLLAERQPSLVIIDLALAGVDGFEVCRTIRADRRFKATKIIAAGVRTGAGFEEKVLAAGADGFIAVPFSADDLSRCIDALFASEK